MDCGIDYAERVKLLTEWIDSIDVNTFDINNITYPDPKIGDCVIPYPDARHKDQIIPGSFKTNQYNAAVATNNTTEIDRLSQELHIGKYATPPKSDATSISVDNPSVRMILGVILLIGGAALVLFLLRRKK